jgi:hypothetical protein
MGLGGLVLLFLFCVVSLGVLVCGVGRIASFLMLGYLLFVTGDLRFMGTNARLMTCQFLLRPFQDGGGFPVICGPSGVVAFPGSVVELIAGVFGGGIRVHGGWS